MTTSKRSERAPRLYARWLLAAAGVVLVIGGAALGLDGSAQSPVHAAASNPHPTVITAPTPARAIDTPEPAAEPTGRLEIASVGLDAPLLQMTVPPSGTLDPATWWDAYLIDGYGTPGDAPSGTVFVALHSGRGTTEALGDALVNRETGGPALKPGAEINIDGVAFTVTGGRVAEKGSLHEESDLWDGSHDLVVVTCQQYADGRPSKNSLTFAKRP